DVRLGDRLHAHGGLQARLAFEAFEGVLEGEAVQHGCQHAHVVGGRFLDDFPASGELLATEDVARPDDDGELYAARPDALRLRGQAERLVDADAALAAVPEPLATDLEHDPAVFRLESFGGDGIIHAFGPSKSRRDNGRIIARDAERANGTASDPGDEG